MGVTDIDLLPEPADPYILITLHGADRSQADQLTDVAYEAAFRLAENMPGVTVDAESSLEPS